MKKTSIALMISGIVALSGCGESAKPTTEAAPAKKETLANPDRCQVGTPNACNVLGQMKNLNACSIW